MASQNDRFCFLVQVEVLVVAVAVAFFSPVAAAFIVTATVWLYQDFSLNVFRMKKVMALFSQGLSQKISVELLD